MRKNPDATRAKDIAKLSASYRSESTIAEASRVLQSATELDSESARVVAAALRHATVVGMSREAGFNDDEINDSIIGGGDDSHDDADSKDGEGKNLIEKFEDGNMPLPKSSHSDDAGLDAPDDEELEPDDEDGFGLGGLGEGEEGLDGGSAPDEMVEVRFMAPKDQVDDIDELLAQILGDEGSDDSSLEGPEATQYDSAGDLDALGGEEDPAMGSSFDFVQDGRTDHAGGDADFTESDPSDEDLGNSEDDGAGFERPTNMASSRGTSQMQNNNADRRELRGAMREAATVIASETSPKDIGLGQDTIGGTYGGERATPTKHSPNAQITGEAKSPTVTKENSGGNSLQSQNPEFTKRKMPTKQMDRLQQEGEYEKLTFENESDPEFYKVEFNKLEIPSDGEADRTPGFAIPTQNPAYTTNRKTTVASEEDQDADFQDHMFRTLLAAGIPEAQLEKLSYAQGKQAYDQLMTKRAAGKKTDWFKNNVEKGAEGEDLEEVGAKKKADDKLDISVEAKKASTQALRNQYAAALEHEIGRVKAAYSVSTQLAVHGALRPEEIDSNVELWLSDSMSVKAMFVAGQMILRTAGNLQKQIVASTGDQMVRTSSRGTSAPLSVVNQPQYGTTSASELGSLFSVGHIPRQAFNKIREAEEAERRYGSYSREFNPLTD